MEFSLKEDNFLILFVLIVFFPGAGETSLQLSQGALLFGRGCSAGCEDNFDCHEVKASALPGHAGWCEDTFDDSVHASEFGGGKASLFWASWTLLLLLHDVGRTIATVRLLEFKNSLLAAESGYSLHRLNSLFSHHFVIHPCMRLLLPVGCVLRVLVWVGARRFCHGGSGVSRLL